MPDVATLYLKVNSKEVKIGRVELSKLGKQATTTAKDVDKVTKSGTQMTGNMKRSAVELGSSFKIIGRDLSRYVTLPFAAASAASLKFSKDLTNGLGQVETLIAGTGSRIYELQDLVTGLSSETGVAFEDLTRGLYETISAFQDGADTAGRFEAAVKASVAGNATVLDSVKLISAVTKAYGDTSEEAAQKVTDLAFEAVRLGQTTFSELASSIQSVTANSARLRVTQEELFSVYATLTGVTGNASEVTTGFNRALISLAKPTKALSALFAQYTDDQGEVVKTGEDFIQAVGGIGNAFKVIKDAAESTGQPLEEFITRETGVRVALALAGNQAEIFAQKSSEVAEAAGAMEKAYFAATTGIDEFQRVLLQVKQTLASVGAEIGQILLPTIVTIAKQIADAAERFSALDERSQKWIITIAAITAALGPLLILLGSVLRVVKLFSDLKIITGGVAALGALNPVVLGLVAAGILAIVAAMGPWLYETKQQIASLKEMKEAALGIADANTSFYSLVSAYGDLNKASDVNKGLAQDLVQIYGTEFEVALGDAEKTVGNLYDAMLKIEALNFQKELIADAEKLTELLQYQREAADRLRDASETNIQFLDPDALKIFEDEFGSSISRVVAYYREAGKDIKDEFGGDFFRFARELAGNQSEFDDTRKEFTGFLDGLQKDIEQRSGGLLTLQRSFLEDGTEITNSLKVVPKAAYEVANEIQDTLEDATGAPSDGDTASRLKTWQDYFSEITGIAGEAFARIEYEDGKAVGFSSQAGDQGGKRAASAYEKAFADEIAQSQLISNALGQAFTPEDELALLESQADKALGDLNDLLGLSVNQIRGAEDGLFSLKDALGEMDATQLENLYQVFEVTDNSIEGIIGSVQTLLAEIDQLAYTTSLREFNKELMTLRRNAITEGGIIGSSFDKDAELLDMYQTRIGTLYEAMDKIRQDNAIISVDQLRLIKQYSDEIEHYRSEITALSATYENYNAELERFGSLGEVAVKNILRQAGAWNTLTDEQKENRKELVGIATALTLLEGSINALVGTIADIGTAMGAALAGTKSFEESLGDIALALAQNLSLLFISAGLQAIIAGAIPLGASLVAIGLAGQVATSYAQELDARENNAKGGVYDGPVKVFAKGGVLSDYANSIVNKPTLFNNGTAMMGEAGAEAIIPLTRASNGELGVNASGIGGGSGKVTVVVNNYGSDEASVSESTDGAGNTNIEVTIRKSMNAAIADGAADGAMKSRYGVNVRGLN